MVSVKMGLGENLFSPLEMGPSETNVWIVNLVTLLDITSITSHVVQIHNRHRTYIWISTRNSGIK